MEHIFGSGCQLVMISNPIISNITSPMVVIFANIDLICIRSNNCKHHVVHSWRLDDQTHRQITEAVSERKKPFYRRNICIGLFSLMHWHIMRMHCDRILLLKTSAKCNMHMIVICIMKCASSCLFLRAMRSFYASCLLSRSRTRSGWQHDMHLIWNWNILHYQVTCVYVYDDAVDFLCGSLRFGSRTRDECTRNMHFIWWEGETTPPAWLLCIWLPSP